MALDTAKNTENINGDRIMIKCFHDYSTVKDPSALTADLIMKGLEDSTVVKTAPYVMSIH